MNEAMDQRSRSMAGDQDGEHAHAELMREINARAPSRIGGDQMRNPP
jgi:hypothetical protein